MIAKIIEAAVRNRFLVILFTLIIIAIGIHHLYNLPVDAIPDLSDVQVIVFAEYPGQAPQIVEDQVTYPIATTMLAVPNVRVVRGQSMFSMSFTYIIFQDGTDIYWARSRVLEYLSYLTGRLPAGVTPALGPDATGVGWVYEYVLHDTTGKYDLAQLRTMQDWYLRYALRTVRDVAEVASVGGYQKQYQVKVDPNKLASYGIPLSKVREAIRMSNNDVGGRIIEQAETAYLVRGLGYIKKVEDVESIVVGTDGKGTPVQVKHVAQVKLGPQLRLGIADVNGEGQAVAGIVVQRFGKNALEVIDRVKAKIKEFLPSLPPGVEIVPAYDRSALIERAIETLKGKLFEEMLIVSLVCVVFLLHMRSALVAIVNLPLGVLMALIVMYQMGLNANIMSLGGIAIAIGVMVDAAVIMIENAHKHIERAPPGTPREPLIIEAAKEVGPSLFFSLLIITVSFLPVFGLTGESGRLFKPLAYTKTFAMAAAALLAITVVPILMIYFITGKIPKEERNPLNRVTMAAYHPVLKFVLRFRKTAILVAVLLMGVTLYPASQLGTEFMPPLDEGDLLYMPTLMPGVGYTEATAFMQQTDRIIHTFPEVEHVLGKAGRSDSATDPAPINMIETTIKLKDKKYWRPGYTTHHLIRDLDAAVKFPGVGNAWTFPIRTRIDMLSTGIKTPVGLKFIGPDLKVLDELSNQAEVILKGLPGSASVYYERVLGQYYTDFAINRDECARYGLTVGDVQDVIMSALGGMDITNTVEGLERYTVNLRYFQDYRERPSMLRRILIPTPTGAQIPMEQVAKIRTTLGPPMIRTEGARPTAWTYVDIRDIDLGTYVENAKKAIEAGVKLPPGYSTLWSGQFEYLQEARARLKLIIPIAIVLVFILLYINTASLAKVAIVFLAVPFSLVGATWLIWALGYDVSVAVVVGLIALAGLDAETGVVMLLYLDIAYHRALDEGRMKTLDDLEEAVMHGAVLRLRPKLMTVMAILVGLLPIMWSTGTGADMMKRIAAPMVGGVITSFIMELLIYPCIFTLWKWNSEVKKQKFTSTTI
ncbi:MAG: CusA/CzcA family heavy metal efflux RND transporter [Deltaproteobacteria bacterium]|nr:CusA/CzcA family heavy metal efflux RND transporter [Deltaproteobacteria bacterium]